MPYILYLIIYKNIQIEPRSCAAPNQARHEPKPSQTKLHVAQRVRPARKNIILAKKNFKKRWISKNLFIPLQAHISPRQHG